MNGFAPDQPAVTIEAGRYGRTVLVRLKPNEDVTESLERLCRAHGIERAVVRSAVGSLINGTLAVGTDDTHAPQVVTGPGVEIVGLFGEVDAACAEAASFRPSGAAHAELTAILSATDSQVFAGRLVRGMNRSFITVEVTLQEWLADDAPTAT